MNRSNPDSKTESKAIYELMLDMGATSYDPMPPDQHKWQKAEGEPPLYRMWSWMCEHTIHFGHRSAYAVGKDGRELHIEHLMADLDMDEGNTYRYWRLGVAKGLWKNGKAGADKRRLFLCGKVRKTEPVDGEAGPTVCTDYFADLPYEVRKHVAGWPPERVAALYREYKFEEHLEKHLTSASVAAVRSICAQRQHTLFAGVGATPKRQEHVKKGETEEEAAARRGRVEPLIPSLDQYVQTVLLSVRDEFERSYNGNSNSAQTGDSAPAAAPAQAKSANGNGLPAAAAAGVSLLGSEVQKTAREKRVESVDSALSGGEPPSHDGRESDEQLHTVPNAPSQTQETPEADESSLNLLTQIETVREAIETGWGGKLKPGDTIPAKLIETKNSLGLPLRALVVWIGEFAAGKAAKGYPITSPMLFVKAAPRDLPVWGHANRKVIENGLQEEQREAYRQWAAEIDEMFRYTALIEEKLKLSVRVSIENPDHFHAIQELHAGLPPGGAMQFMLFCSGEAKSMDKRALGKQPAHASGDSGPRILSLLMEWSAAFQKGKTKGAGR